jgi:hypothetical protein
VPKKKGRFLARSERENARNVVQVLVKAINAATAPVRFPVTAKIERPSLKPT